MRQCLWYVVTEDTQVNANSHIRKRLGIKERNWMTNNCFGKRISVLSIGLLKSFDTNLFIKRPSLASQSE